MLVKHHRYISICIITFLRFSLVLFRSQKASREKELFFFKLDKTKKTFFYKRVVLVSSGVNLASNETANLGSNFNDLGEESVEISI